MDKVNWDIEAERDLWRAICSPLSWFNEDGVTTHSHSLWWFVHLAWGSEFYFQKHPERPRWLIKEIHEPYLSWLQMHLLRWQKYCLEGGTDRYFIASVVPRDYGKSVTTTKAAMLWLHLREPDMSTLIASGVSELSEDFFSNIKSVLEGSDKDSWFSWLFGDWKRGARRWKADSLSHGYRTSGNMSEGSFDITAVNIGMTGYHHRIHCWDDPIIKNKLREGRDAYIKAVHDAVNASYNALQSNGLMLFVLTRYFDDDVAGRHFRDEGIMSWSGMPCPNTMMFDKVPMGKGRWNVYFLQTEDELTGEPTHKLLWTKEKIAEAKRRDPEDFACQQQNNPGSGERAPIVESQLHDIYMEYKDFQYTVPIEFSSVHIDTAFKTAKTIGKGDDNAITVWHHDARRNGIIYLDTDLIRASNEWREEDFNDKLVEVLVNLRRRQYYVGKLTDEVEPGGKAGTYKNRLLSVLTQAGLNFPRNNFLQINRTSDKKARIRSTLGYWAEGYVRILLHKDSQGNWILSPTVRKFLNQVLRIDVVTHEDIIDAASDVFTPGIWKPPVARNQFISDEGAIPHGPGDETLKSFGKPLSTEELYSLMDENKGVRANSDDLRGWDPRNDEYEIDLPAEQKGPNASYLP